MIPDMLGEVRCTSCLHPRAKDSKTQFVATIRSKYEVGRPPQDRFKGLIGLNRVYIARDL